MKLFNEGTTKFNHALERFCNRASEISEEVCASVSRIIDGVRSGGDDALFEYTRKLDGYDPARVKFSLSRREMKASLDRIPGTVASNLEKMAERVRLFHEKQLEKGYSITNDAGGTISLSSFPVDVAGIYIPGGKAAYPSTAIMNAVPARVAGVGNIVAAVPAPRGRPVNEVLAACYIAGVDRLFLMGGAQAVAAFAFGTKNVPRVDVIAGPGNAYVTEAKRQLYGAVGLDMLAGPSELVVLADSGAEARCVAYDILSQAEHGEDAFVSLVTNSPELARKVMALVKDFAGREKRRDILRSSLEFAPLFVVRSLKKGISLVSRLAPEHLSLQVKTPHKYIPLLKNAGTIFLGKYSPVAVGDYIAGINHTLPTGGSARFASPLGVYHFMKRLNIVTYGPLALKKDLPIIKGLSDREGLTAHGNAASVRFNNKGKRRS